MSYISLHNHTCYSNVSRGFMDSTIKIEELVDYAYELGMPGICVTDHECTTAAFSLIDYVNAKKKSDPEGYKDFKAICGNEIYLLDRNELDKKNCSNFYHFILIAKDLEGWKQIVRLSSTAWQDNYFYSALARTPTFYDSLFEELGKNPGHLIGCTACLGSYLDKTILKGEDPAEWLLKMKKAFSGNFYMEMQPGISEEQKIVNLKIVELSKKLNIPYIISCDTHYLKEEDREVHKAFLTSDDKNGGNREVDAFYYTTYLQSEEQARSYLTYLSKEDIDYGFENTLKICGQIEEYSLDNPVVVPYKPTSYEEPDEKLCAKFIPKCPTMQWFKDSTFQEDRHMLRDIIKELESRPEEFDNPETYKEVEENLNTIKIISEATNTHWSAYLLLVKGIVATAWNSSYVGTGRGSCGGFILCYILGITQVNPLREEVKTYAYRFLNPERVSVPDIDLDIIGEQRDNVIEDLREVYGGERHCVKVLTISTAKAKKVLQIACRGLGYTPEEALYLGSFITSDRGIQRNLTQTLYGDEKLGFEPNKQFRDLMESKYPDVLKIALRLEDLPVGSGSHAGGIILTTDDITNYCGLMRTSSQDLICALDLHKAERAGLIKVDLLATDAMGKLKITMDLLMKAGLIKDYGSLKATYDHYLDPYIIDRSSEELWDSIDQHKIISLFQFDSKVGWDCIEKGQPRNLQDMVTLNSLMRLVAAPGETEQPIDRYVRIKNDIQIGYKEMEDAGLTKEEQEWLAPFMAPRKFCSSNQEDFMYMVQQPLVGGHSLLFADKLRKAISKKDGKLFEEIKQEYYNTIEVKNLSFNLCDYVWKKVVMPQAGYAFNSSHVLFYSLIALQEANLVKRFGPIFWNTANLISDSGGQDGVVNLEKIAVACAKMQKEGITISAPDINKSEFDFSPDKETNSILFGLKAISGVGSNEANIIVANRPYISLEDFYNKIQDLKQGESKISFGNTPVIALIKAGAFDQLENKPREEIMKDFLKLTFNPLKKLTTNNLEDLEALGVISEDQKKLEVRYIKFKKYFFQKENISQQGKSPATSWYKLPTPAYNKFFLNNFADSLNYEQDYIEEYDGSFSVKRGPLEKLIDKLCANFKTEVIDNPLYLDKVNQSKLEALWAEVSDSVIVNHRISKWEMETLNLYLHNHELEGVNAAEQNIVSFDKLKPDPIPIATFEKGGVVFNKYQTYGLAGAVLAVDKAHGSITLLTLSGVVSVRLGKEKLAYYNRDIVIIGEDGKKIILEESWLNKGTLLYITGYRMGEQFNAKTYKDSPHQHAVQLIKGMNDFGVLFLKQERIREEEYL